MICHNVNSSHDSCFVILSFSFLFNNNYNNIYLHCGVGPMGGTCLLQSKRLLPFGFAGQSNSTILKLYSVHQLSIGCVLLCIAR